jgi:UPF0716 protein FxsA
MTVALLVRLAFVLYVVTEIALFVLGVRWLGGAVMFGWVLATAVLGAVLVRREGIRAIETVQAAVRERRAPERTVPDRGMVATGGLLLILPGPVTDLVGLILVMPVTRPLARRLLAVMGAAVAGRVGTIAVAPPPTSAPPSTPGPVIRGEVLDSRDENPPSTT